MFVMVECIGEVTVKKSCKYGKYRSFEHLLCFLYELHGEKSVRNSICLIVLFI